MLRLKPVENPQVSHTDSEALGGLGRGQTLTQNESLRASWLCAL